MCFAARQKEKASSTVTELVQAVKRPRALSESANRPPVIPKPEGRKEDHETAKNLSRRKSETSVVTSTFTHQKPQEGRRRNSMHIINELPEKKHKHSRRRSFMGYDFPHQLMFFNFRNDNLGRYLV